MTVLTLVELSMHSVSIASNVNGFPFSNLVIVHLISSPIHLTYFALTIFFCSLECEVFTFLLFYWRSQAYLCKSAELSWTSQTSQCFYRSHGQALVCLSKHVALLLSNKNITIISTSSNLSLLFPGILIFDGHYNILAYLCIFLNIYSDISFESKYVSVCYLYLI